MDTPDALRLSRLDKLINQLGEHQLSIRQQGTSVTDLDERLKALDKRVADELQALWPLRGVDVQGELTGARTSIEKLAKQVALLSRDQEEGRIQSEKRLQQVEARQSDMERQLSSLAAAAAAAQAAPAAALEELQVGTKAMLSEVIGRIADQFDALQASLDAAIDSRAAEAEERAAAAAAAQRGLEEQRAWVEARATALAHQVDAQLQAAAAATEQAAAAAAEQAREEAAALRVQLGAVQAVAADQAVEQEAARHRLEEHSQQLASIADAAEQQRAAAAQAAQQQAAALEAVRDELAAAQRSTAKAQAAATAALQQRVDAVSAEQGAAAERAAGAEGLLRQALTVWQQGMEEQLGGLEGQLGAQLAAAQQAQQSLAARFEEYKGYVKRLRREVAEARAEQDAAGAHIAAVRRDFDSTHHKMDCVHAEAAALGGALLDATRAAAAAGSAVRHLSPAGGP